MMPSTTAVSILVTVKSHWGATPLSDGNGRCPVFRVGVGHLHVIDVFFQIQTQTFGWITWQLSFSPCSNRRYIFIYHSWLHFPVRFFHKGLLLVRRSPINPKSPPWGSEVTSCPPWIPALLRERGGSCASKWPHWLSDPPGSAGNPWRLESSAWIYVKSQKKKYSQNGEEWPWYFDQKFCNTQIILRYTFGLKSWSYIIPLA